MEYMPPPPPPADILIIKGAIQIIYYISVLYYIFKNFICLYVKMGIKILKMLRWGMSNKKVRNHNNKCSYLLNFIEREREMFYLMMHSTHFIYDYMALDIWLRTILIVRKETRCHHIGYSYWLTAKVLLYAPSHIQDNTYHGLCYTSRGALAGTSNSSIGPPMKDRSDDPPHHEQTLYLWATSRSINFINPIAVSYSVKL